eukprot:gene1202-2337_t
MFECLLTSAVIYVELVNVTNFASPLTPPSTVSNDFSNYGKISPYKKQMVKFLDWHALNEEQISTLEETTVTADVKSLLEEYLKIPYVKGPRRSTAIDFHFHNYAFCKEMAFDARRIAAFMSIMNDVFLRDTHSSSPLSNSDSSFALFRETLLRHSVERPPVSIQVFYREDIEPMVEYALESYYRQFRVYKYIFTDKTRVILKQVLPQDVDTPKIGLPLNSGFKVFAPVPPNLSNLSVEDDSLSPSSPTSSLLKNNK